jgi:hypothetical protein
MSNEIKAGNWSVTEKYSGSGYWVFAVNGSAGLKQWAKPKLLKLGASLEFPRSEKSRAEAKAACAKLCTMLNTHPRFSASNYGQLFDLVTGRNL